VDIAKAIEYMIIDALLAAEPHMKIANQIDKPEKYVYLTDNIMPRIESTPDPELAESRAIFDRIRTRDLYKSVDFQFFEWDHRELCRTFITPKRIVEASKALFKEDEDMRPIVDLLEERHVIVDFSPMHYGMQDKNPLDSIKFYSKRNPNGEYDIIW
jgi:deoxynucleoside triphosphate triphosphohydrolase SAMHD1